MACSEQNANDVSLSVFLEEASDEGVKTFRQSLNKDDQLRVRFWRKSRAVDDCIFRLTRLLNSFRSGKFKQLKDVAPEDEVYFFPKDPIEKAQKHAELLRQRMELELSAEFAKSWSQKEEVLRNLSAKPCSPKYHMNPMTPIPPMAHRGLGIMHMFQNY